ncbi:hypothetical protein C8J24_3146 [Sphingomonas aerolata]|uniref:Uncharacterized protein n=1 Tax=Sphingomonas aerolata TaxID=185951 RepID=A0A2T4YNF3_9SPHN|nr:hypothetical protein C8J24_3146 [Sphingomonas aerolata]
MHRFRIGFFRPKVDLKGSQPLLKVRNFVLERGDGVF